ncbi:hypothetical protein [Spirosoma endbachense]|uniref:Uncharacterized protein n=1 Tax=Spirosoma endbachense TaxID=2666025 RepID=A0A6P1VY41_9BACT|nr:hypothetical protein [Spirosoma endbachense]QHV97564.1 hypothetical protein GJR95_22270 [Spirosoma endbachense]
MALQQVGYLGKAGPVFVDQTSDGKYVVIVGQVFADGTMMLKAKPAAYADNLRNSTAGPNYIFPYSSAQCSLGPYSENQTISVAPAYLQPATGPAFDYYLNKASDWVTATSTAGNSVSNETGGATTSTNTSSSGGTTTSTGSTSSGGGTVTTTSNGGTVTTTDTTYKAPTIGEQISTFLSNYWWLVLLVLVALLWKPLIAPALGLSKKRRSYR